MPKKEQILEEKKKFSAYYFLKLHLHKKKKSQKEVKKQ
jgi:hypothetical protein